MGERRDGGHRGKQPHWRHDRGAAGCGSLLDRRENTNGQRLLRFHRQRAQAIPGWYSIRLRKSSSVTADHSPRGPRKHHDQERPAFRSFLEKLRTPALDGHRSLTVAARIGFRFVTHNAIAPDYPV